MAMEQLSLVLFLKLITVTLGTIIGSDGGYSEVLVRINSKIPHDECKNTLKDLQVNLIVSEFY